MQKRKGSKEYLRSLMERIAMGRHFDREIIVLCVRWYLSFKLSARDLVVFKNSISLKMIR